MPNPNVTSPVFLRHPVLQLTEKKITIFLSVQFSLAWTSWSTLPYWLSHKCYIMFKKL